MAMPPRLQRWRNMISMPTPTKVPPAMALYAGWMLCRASQCGCSSVMSDSSPTAQKVLRVKAQPSLRTASQ